MMNIFINFWIILPYKKFFFIVIQGKDIGKIILLNTNINKYQCIKKLKLRIILKIKINLKMIIILVQIFN